MNQRKKGLVIEGWKETIPQKKTRKKTMINKGKKKMMTEFQKKIGVKKIGKNYNMNHKSQLVLLICQVKMRVIWIQKEKKKIKMK